MNKNSIKILFIILIVIIAVFIVIWIKKINTNGTTKIVGVDDFLPFKNNSSIITSTDSTLQLNENLPIIHATTTFYPLFSAIVQSTYNQDEYNNELQLVSTQQAINDIKDGSANIIVATMPSNEQLDSLENCNLEFVKIGKEPLILYVNKDNPINNLTIDDITNIYNGNINNWSKLGGKNQKITTYQLEDGNSSQTCFNNIFHNNITDKFHKKATDMCDIIIQAANNKNSIGYAFNSFYSLMCNSENLKLLNVQDIAPTQQNFENNTYPLLFDVYFIYNKDVQNENINKLLDWILSEQGQSLIKDMGYIQI